MEEFINTHRSKIKGVLSCFDRMIFRGYLPIQDGGAMAMFLNQNNLRFRDLKSFLLENGQRVKDHAMKMAADSGRPYQYLKQKITG